MKNSRVKLGLLSKTSCEQQPTCGPHSWVWPGLWVYAGCPSLAPLPTAHCLPHLCVGSALHRGTSPTLYIRELCSSTVTIQRRISLRSSAQAELLVPRTRTVIRQRRAFSVAGSTAWNGLPVVLHLTPVAHYALFLSTLKTTLFDWGWARSAPE